jgi:hypothetical protein
MVVTHEANGHFFTHERPPREPGRKVDIISAQPGMMTRAVITSREMATCRTHWLGNGDSKPCSRNEACPWCKERIPTRWKGYLCGFLTTTYCPCIIEITSGAVATCPELADRAIDLRGKIVSLTRNGASSNAPVRAALEERTGTLLRAPLPAPFDLPKALFRIWRFDPADYLGKNRVAENAERYLNTEAE